MFSAVFRRASVVALMALCLIAGAQPALAVASLSQTGTVGFYSLNDTSASPGADAIYRYESGYDVWRLRHVVVHAPNVRAVSGSSAQKVGWAFTVQRRECGWGPRGLACGSWYVRYSSPTFAATTNDATNAPFSDESVGVRLPQMIYDGTYEYRAIVKMFWYRATGNVQGTATARVYYYKQIMGTTTQTSTKYCWAYN
jgi:hypothetical protein